MFLAAKGVETEIVVCGVASSCVSWVLRWGIMVVLETNRDNASLISGGSESLEDEEGEEEDSPSNSEDDGDVGS